MPVPAPPDATWKPAARTRLVGATRALDRLGTARWAAPAVGALVSPGQPAGMLALPTVAAVPGVVEHVHDAITGAGGNVVTVVDHAAEAGAAGPDDPAVARLAGLGATATIGGRR